VRLDPAAYACRTFGTDDGLPWDNVHSGVTKEFLKQEYRRALAAELTENCRVECRHCGIGCKDGGTAALGKPAAPDTGLEKKQCKRVKHPAPQELRRLPEMKYSRLQSPLSLLDL
jgi:hypothetical protein